MELKVAPQIEPFHQAQALSYLKVTNADLAFVVNFGEEKVAIKRLPNFLREQTNVYSWQPQPAAPDMLYSELVNELLAALHRIYFELGSGFLHQIYRRAAMVELKQQGIGYEYMKEIPNLLPKSSSYQSASSFDCR